MGVRDPRADLHGARIPKVTRCYFDRYGMHVTYSKPHPSGPVIGDPEKARSRTGLGEFRRALSRFARLVSQILRPATSRCNECDNWTG